jgi:RNA polymerase sigma-70 factor (ECF subfamily)
MRLRAGQGEVLSSDLYGGVDGDPSAPTGEAAIEQLAMREWVWTALSELPEVLRVTAMLRYFGSHASYEEIAAILGVPVGTVRSRLAQVKIKLADALLKTAGLAHDEARRITASSNRLFSELFAENNRAEVTAASMDVYSKDVELLWTDGSSLHGRENLAAGFRMDQEAGVKLHLTNVFASKDIVVVEADFENPPEDPFHCPPASTQVYLYRSGRIQQMRFYYPPRPSEEG